MEERIQLSCALKLLLSFLGALKVEKIFEKPEVRTHRIWIESNGFFEFHLSFLKFAFILKFHIAECATCFRRVGIYIQCHLNRSPPFGDGDHRRTVSPIPYPAIARCE